MTQVAVGPGTKLHISVLRNVVVTPLSTPIALTAGDTFTLEYDVSMPAGHVEIPKGASWVLMETTGPEDLDARWKAIGVDRQAYGPGEFVWLFCARCCQSNELAPQLHVPKCLDCSAHTGLIARNQLEELTAPRGKVA